MQKNCTKVSLYSIEHITSADLSACLDVIHRSFATVAALINALTSVEVLLENAEGDEKTGIKIIAKALEEPMRQIAYNAGLEGSVIVNNVRSHKGLNYGFNAYTEQYVDLIEEGIVDPTKVTRSALQNAASIAAMILTTESLVAEKKEDAAAANAAAAAAAAAGGGGMY